VLALVAISIPLLSKDDAGDVQIGSDSVARMSADDGSLELAAELGQRPGASAIGFGSLWVAQPDRGVVTRLDVEDGSVTDTIRVGTAPAGVAIGLGSVWVTNGAVGTVSRINVETNEVSQELQAGSGPSGIAIGDGALWIADSVGSALLRIDPTSGPVQTVAIAGQPTGVAFTPNGVWVSVASNTVARIDPADPTVTLTQPVGSGPTALVSAFGSIWVANHLDGTVSRLDPSTGRIEATVEVGKGPNALVATDDSLWVAKKFDGSISSIDPTTNTPVATVPVGGAVASLAIDGDRLWVAVGASAIEHRGGTLTVSAESGGLTSLDPALAYDGQLWQILISTNDGLVAYKKVGGPEGATLVPDLASALPEVSADGLSYRFPLRQGIRYSTGDLVMPEDFRRAMERSISLSEDAAGLFEAIDGADACARNPDTCDLSQSIVIDDQAVTFHLAHPDPDLPLKLAMPFAFPVPDDTPAVDQGLDPLPATGPYMVAHAGADGIELVRNPGFREWSGAAQPDGFVDAISWTFGEDVDSAFERLDAGDLDLMIEAPGPEDLAILRSAHPDRVVTWPAAVTLFLGFDVRKPPFDDARVRQALNFAIDRSHVVDLLGGSTAQHATCQILPPSFQGYAPFCPYTLDPEAGVWSAPDLDKAKALVEEAGAVGEPVTVWVTSAHGVLPAGAVETMRYVTDVLNELGLHADLEIVQDADAYFDAHYQEVPGSRAHPQLFMGGWGSDYLGAGNFIDPLFSCDSGANAYGWCDEDLDARIDEAFLLNATDPGASNQAWADIDHQLVEEAAFAALTNPVTTHAVSARLGNIQVHPQWGILLSRLWVQ
jgi:YVTN family beta-propeller protein